MRLDFFFFGGPSSSSSSSARVLPRAFLATAVPPPCFLPRTTAAVSSSRSAGASTTNRYLHLGQSIFLPTREAFLMVTIASQLGHWTLNPVVTAIRRPPRWTRRGRAGRNVSSH